MENINARRPQDDDGNESVVSELLVDFLSTNKSNSFRFFTDDVCSSICSPDDIDSSNLDHYNDEDISFQDEIQSQDVQDSIEEGIESDINQTILIDTTLDADSGVHRRKNYGSIVRLGNVDIRDHPSLTNPSSHVNFGEDETIVIVDNFEQFTLEKKKNDSFLTAKQASLASPGILILRSAYTLIAFVLAGFILAFCLNIVLFLFLGLAIQSGMVTNRSEFSFFNFIGTLLSIPVITSGLSQIMVIAQVFVMDTWKGGKFLKTTFLWDSVVVDWITFFIFFGFPLLVGTISLYTGTKDWWPITSLSWFVLVLIYYFFFAVAVIIYEVTGCFELIKYHPKLREGANGDNHESSFGTLGHAIKLRLKQRYSGYETLHHVANGSESDTTRLSYSEMKRMESIKSFVSPLSRLSRQKFMSCLYNVHNEPVRAYDVGEVLEFTPFVTNSSWGLELIFCRDRNANFVAIVDGEAALTKHQVVSSIVCFIFGSIMKLFVVIGVLVWFGTGVVLIIVISVAYFAFTFQSIRKSMGLSAAYRSIMRHSDDNRSHRKVQRNQESNALYQVQESFRISEPKPGLYWTLFSLDLIAFIVIPVIALLTSKNYRVAILFICLSVLFFVRNVINAPASFRELGSLDGIEVNNNVKTARAEWREKHRLGKILSDVSVGKKSNFWVGIFLFFLAIFGALFILATFRETKNDDDEVKRFGLASKNHSYGGSKSLNYASCSLVGESAYGSLADFTFLAAIAYFDENESSRVVSEWFAGEVYEESDVVIDFQQRYRKAHPASSVSYKLFDFPSEKTKIISVRGTITPWDALADVQLWMASFLAQTVRTAAPFGEVLTPILPHLVKAVSIVEEKALVDVSYYKEIVAFIKELVENNASSTIRVVGHSLGGGIAMIAAAQTNMTGIGISGPNAVISRMTFDPSITLDALDQYTFNVIPDRDIVPRLDDLSENYQRIQCRSKTQEFIACHSARRSLCEIMYTCGSSNRPIPCDCVNEFGYDIPETKGGLSFIEECRID